MRSVVVSRAAVRAAMFASVAFATTSFAAAPVFTDNSGERLPGSDFAQPASLTVSETGGATFSSPVFGVKSDFSRLVDLASGQIAGRAQFNGLTLTRDVGANSARLFADFLTNRDLTVVLAFSTTPAVTYTITNVRIASYRTSMAQRPSGGYSEVEEIGLTFHGTFTVNDGTTQAVFERLSP